MVSGHPFRHLPQAFGRLSHWVADRSWLQISEQRRKHDTDDLLAAIDRSMSDMSALTRSEPGPVVLLPYRLAAAGIDVACLEAEHNALYRDLVKVCGDCTQWRRCARDLACAGRPGGTDYCANATAIDVLAGNPPH